MIRFVRYLTVIVFILLLLTGKTAKPRDLESLPRPVQMVSSFYGPGFDGHSTASGVRFDRTAFTAAHRTLPFGTRLKLTNPSTRKSVTVKVTDRGPYSELAGIRYFAGSRDLDVSEGAARSLGFERDGVTTLTVQLLPPIPTR